MIDDRNDRGCMLEVWPGLWINPRALLGMHLQGSTLHLDSTNTSKILPFDSEEQARAVAERLARGAS